MSLGGMLLEPFQHGFMVQAMLVGMFVSAVCAVLSCFIVLKGWSLVGDALSHAVLPGIVIAYLIGLPMALGAVVSGVACVALAGVARTHSRIKPDALLGIAFTGFMAVGLILVVANPGDVHFLHVLFGNLLGLEREDMLQTLALGSVTLLAVLLLRKDLVLICFDPAHARVIGLAPGRLELILLILVALTVVAALQAVGVALVMAMLVTPGCVGFLMSARFDRMMLTAVASAVLSAFVGTLASFWLDGATGACIVLAETVCFLLALAFAPRRGLLRDMHRRKPVRAAAAAIR